MSRSLKQALLIFSLLFAPMVSRAQESNQKALFDAIRDNNIELIQSIHEKNPLLIDSSITKNAFMSSSTFYPVHEALRNSNLETIVFLINSGADPSRRYHTRGFMSGSFKSSLEILVEYRDLQMLIQLIDNLKVDAESYTRSLLWASENNEVQKVKYLLSKGEHILLKGQE